MTAYIDPDLAQVQGKIEQDILNESICCLCSGVVQLPGCQCQTCEKVFCKECLIQNKLVLSPSSSEYKCPFNCSTKNDLETKVSRIMRNQISNLKFQCILSYEQLQNQQQDKTPKPEQTNDDKLHLRFMNSIPTKIEQPKQSMDEVKVIDKLRKVIMIKNQQIEQLNQTNQDLNKEKDKANVTIQSLRQSFNQQKTDLEKQMFIFEPNKRQSKQIEKESDSSLSDMDDSSSLESLKFKNKKQKSVQIMSQRLQQLTKCQLSLTQILKQMCSDKNMKPIQFKFLSIKNDPKKTNLSEEEGNYLSKFSEIKILRIYHKELRSLDNFPCMNSVTQFEISSTMGSQNIYQISTKYLNLYKLTLKSIYFIECLKDLRSCTTLRVLIIGQIKNKKGMSDRKTQDLIFKMLPQITDLEF